MAPAQLYGTPEGPRQKKNPFKTAAAVLAEPEVRNKIIGYGAVAAVVGGLVVAAVASKHKGDEKIDRGIEELCSEKGGLSIVNDTPDQIVFAMTAMRVTPQEVASGVKDYLLDGKTSREHVPATVRFAKGRGGIEPVSFEVPGSTPYPLGFILRDGDCLGNLNPKISTARQVYVVERFHRTQER